MAAPRSRSGILTNGMRGIGRSGAIALCLVLGVAVWLVVRDVRVPVPIQYDYDEGVYAATADAVAHGGHLYRDIFLSQPPLFVLLVRGVFALWGTSLGVARSAVVVLSAVWLVAMLATVWARGSPWGGLFAICLVLGRATFLNAAQTVQMEVPGEALACAAVALVAWGLRRPGHLWWAGAGILATLAAMTKLTAVTAVIPLIGAAVAERDPASRWRWRMLAAGSLLAFGALLPVVGTAGFVDQVFGFHLALAHKLDQPIATHVGAIGGFLAEEWPLSLAAMLGAWRAVTSGAAFERALIAWLVVDCVALAGLTPLWEHHLIILVSPMGLLAGTALRPHGHRLLDPGRIAGGDGRGGPGWLSASVLQSRDGARLVAAALLAGCTIGYLGLGMSAARRPSPSPQLEHVVRRISEAVPPDGKVLTDDPMVAFLAGRRVADGFIDSSLTRIWAGQISEERLMVALRAHGTDAVVLWRGTFREFFPRLEAAATRVFPVTVTAPEGRILLLRRRGATHAP